MDGFSVILNRVQAQEEMLWGIYGQMRMLLDQLPSVAARLREMGGFDCVVRQLKSLHEISQEQCNSLAHLPQTLHHILECYCGCEQDSLARFAPAFASFGNLPPSPAPTMAPLPWVIENPCCLWRGGQGFELERLRVGTASMIPREIMQRFVLSAKQRDAPC